MASGKVTSLIDKIAFNTASLQRQKSTITAPSDGFFYAVVVSSPSFGQSIKLDGVEIATRSGATDVVYMACGFIKKGQVITSSGSVSFYPFS